MGLFFLQDYEDNATIMEMSDEELKQTQQNVQEHLQSCLSACMSMLLLMFDWVVIHMVCWKPFHMMLGMPSSIMFSCMSPTASNREMQVGWNCK